MDNSEEYYKMKYFKYKAKYQKALVSEQHGGMDFLKKGYDAISKKVNDAVNSETAANIKKNLVAVGTGAVDLGKKGFVAAGNVAVDVGTKSLASAQQGLAKVGTVAVDLGVKGLAATKEGIVAVGTAYTASAVSKEQTEDDNMQKFVVKLQAVAKNEEIDIKKFDFTTTTGFKLFVEQVKKKPEDKAELEKMFDNFCAKKNILGLNTGATKARCNPKNQTN